MGRMRIEIALIVGIVFFCCWCIYIIIRMNSSVSLSVPQTAHRDASTIEYPISQNHYQQHLSSGSPSEHYLRAQVQQPSNQQVPMKQQQQIPTGGYQQLSASSIQQPQRLHHYPPPIRATPSWPTSLVSTGAQLNLQQVRNGPPASPADHIGGASTWHDYSSVSAAQPANRWQSQQLAAASQGSHQLNRPAPISNLAPSAYLHYNALPALNGRQAAPANNWQPIGARNSATSNQLLPGELDTDPDPDPDEASESSQTENGDGEQTAEAADEDSEPLANLNKELEEQVGKRSFSEDEDESNERDKDGNLIVTHRKHIINGKPVQRSAEQNRKQVDFDKVVGEIEGDDQSSEYDDAPDGDQQNVEPSQQQTDESRPRKTIQSADVSRRVGNLAEASKIGQKRASKRDEGRKSFGKRRDKTLLSTGKPNKKGERESHEHRLHESLTAQQWDDDGASAPQNKSPDESGSASSQNVTLLQPAASSTTGEPAQSADVAQENQEDSDEEGSEKVEEEDDDTGPQQVEAELKEMDMLVDPDRFMSSTEEGSGRRRRRRKRQVSLDGDQGADKRFARNVSSSSPLKGTLDQGVGWKVDANKFRYGGAMEPAGKDKILKDANIRSGNSTQSFEDTIVSTVARPNSNEIDAALGLAELIFNFGGRFSGNKPEIEGNGTRPQANKAVAQFADKRLQGEQEELVPLSNDTKFVNEETADGGGIGLLSKPAETILTDLAKETELKASLEREVSSIAPDVGNNRPLSSTTQQTNPNVLGLLRENVIGSSIGSSASSKAPLKHLGSSKASGVFKGDTRDETDAALEASGDQSDQSDVVEGEADMSYEMVAQPPYSMAPVSSGATQIANGTFVNEDPRRYPQYSDVVQSPYLAQRPERDLSQTSPTYGQPAQVDSVDAGAAYNGHQSQPVGPHESIHASHLPPGPLNYNQHQSDEPPFEAYHGAGPQLQSPPSSNGQTYLSNGAASGLYDPALAGDNDANHLASASKVMKKKKKKKKKKKFNKSMMSDSKHAKAKAVTMKKKSKYKKGGMKKKKKKNKKKAYKVDKEFRGDKKGKKGKKGHGEKGANKGNLYYMDKGYKKRGFKKAYKKLEEGDHKTYFDEFRDKDHNKKWKRFKDKHQYSQKKNWTGKDRKKYNNYLSDQLKDNKEKQGAWREKAASKYKKIHKYKGDSSRISKKKKIKKGAEKKKKKSNEYYA